MRFITFPGWRSCTIRGRAGVPVEVSGGRQLMRILHVLAPAPYGSIETVVLRLTEALPERGCDTHVASIVEDAEADHPFDEAARAAGTPLHSIGVGSRRYLPERKAVRTLIERPQPDVVHSHSSRADVVDPPAARSAGCATVSTIHGFVGNSLKKRSYEWVQRRFLRSFDAVLEVSRIMVHELVDDGAPRDRVQNYDSRSWVDRHIRLYRSLARGRPRSSK